MDEEPVLLHEPNLMLALLRSAAFAAAGIEDAIARLRANLALAGEPAPADPVELRQRLAHALASLDRAGAVAPAGEGRFRLTAAGAKLLAEHPEGVDETMLWPVGGPSSAASAHDDPRPRAYRAGLHAFAAGRPIDANPHPSDTPDQLAWENGWSEARDEAREGSGGLNAPPGGATGRSPPRSAA